MKLLLSAVAAVLLSATLLFAGGTSSVATPAEHVVMLHGLGGNSTVWDTAKAQYEAAGFTVHALSLPNSGWTAGDTLANADYVEAYLAAHSLVDVQVDGHSLGGSLVYELVRVRRNPAITSAVTRDSSIQNATGDIAYFFGFPYCPTIADQCEGGAQRNRILAAPLADVPILNLTRTTDTTGQPDVDCYRHFNISHDAFRSNTAVTGAAISWAQGESPCVESTPTATATNTATAVPTATATATTPPTAPTPTSTPIPTCTWWQRLFRMC